MTDSVPAGDPGSAPRAPAGPAVLRIEAREDLVIAREVEVVVPAD